MSFTLAEGSVLIEGPRYDLPKVLPAAEGLVDRLAAVLGDGRSTVMSPGLAGGRRFPWPDPGKDVARGFWSKVSRQFDVIDEALSHHMGAVTVKAFLLGKCWCVLDPVTRELRASDGGHYSMLDPAPTVCVYGREDPARPGSYALITPETAAAVRGLVEGDLADLGLVVDVWSPVPARPGAPTQAVFIAFPHDVYGLGRDWITVRCVTPDGEEVPSPEDAN